MEQFRQLGEALGSLKALMVFKDHIQINQRQCCLLLDVFTFTYDLIAEEIKQNLKFEEKHDKWKFLQQPLKEIHRIFKEGEAYVKHCLEIKDWWAKAITLYRNKDCVEFYIHNLLSCIPIVVEAIEFAGETSGWDQDEMQRRKIINSSRYRKEIHRHESFPMEIWEALPYFSGFLQPLRHSLEGRQVVYHQQNPPEEDVRFDKAREEINRPALEEFRRIRVDGGDAAAQLNLAGVKGLPGKAKTWE